MDAKKREIRTVDCQLAVREAPEGQEGESRTITGTAIVFNVESEVIDDWGERFREVILPEACTMEFLNSQDVKANMLHERDLTVARANHGVGTLRLWVDEKHVYFEFDAPRCDIGDRCLEMVKLGVYSGCSFEFVPKDYDVIREGNEVKIVHRSFEWLGAITIGMDPAYRQTSVNARELEKIHTPEPVIEEKDEEAERLKRECLEKDALEREMERRLNVMRGLDTLENYF